jgi:hypothetical protein
MSFVLDVDLGWERRISREVVLIALTDLFH